VNFVSDLALSATATTALFTLLGTISGATLAGMVAIYLEALRRNWRRQDAEVEDAKKRHAEQQLLERKTLYPQLLAKGIQLDYAVASAFNSEELEHLDESISKERFRLQYDRIFNRIASIMQEWEALRVQAEMLAEDNVRDLISKWDRYFVRLIDQAALGVRGSAKDWRNSPYHLLVKAIHNELQVVTNHHGSRPSIQNLSPSEHGQLSGHEADHQS
jgi:hypothetical protein